MDSSKFKQTILPLTKKVYPMVYRMLGNEEDANDAVQEVMLKLWNKRKELNEHPNVAGYVVTVARNFCLDLLKKRQPKLVNADADTNVTDYQNAHGEVEWKELNSIIEQILKELPNQQGEILVMRDMDGLEFSEIATATGLKVEHVRVLLSRARKQVSAKLKKIYSYE